MRPGFSIGSGQSPRKPGPAARPGDPSSLLGRAAGRFARHFRAAPWPNATSAVSAAVGLLLAKLSLSMESSPVASLALGAVCLGWFALAVLCQADALGRYREYVRLKSVFVRRGLCVRVLRLVSGSRCQRDAALFAAREAGCGDEAAAFYRGMGYRWRHLLPDAIVRNPLYFFHPAFLRATFLPGARR